VNTLVAGKKIESTTYTSFFMSESSLELAAAQQHMLFAGAISDLTVRLAKAPGAGKTWQFMILSSAASGEGVTGVGCSIIGTEKACTSNLESVAIVKPGDLVSLRGIPGGKPNEPEFINWMVKFSED
jgi:hypothetical protein